MALTKTRSVLDLDADSVGALVLGGKPGVSFCSYDDDDESLRRQTAILADDWVDMGSPEQVTVTIEPGDLLNR